MNTKMLSLWLLTGVTTLWAGLANAQSSCGQTPVAPSATPQASKLLCYLKNNSYISGQTDLGDADQVKQWTGRYPAIVAFDFYHYTDGDTSDTQKAIDFAKNKKGIVAFQWHWKCPRGGEYYTDCPFDQDMNNPSSKLYQDIDVIGRELKKMGDAGVPVVFRPLHESNDNFMWWAKKGADNYKRLWKLVYDRVNAQGANNVLWVFNGMAGTDGWRSQMRDWYPGDAMVDVVSSDYFQSGNDYNTLKAIGSNKVVGVSETFNALNPSSESPFSFSVVWALRDCYRTQGQPSTGDVKGCQNSWRTAMANSRTITIDQLPDFTTVEPDPTNLATNKPAVASSIEGPGYEAGKAVDNNTSTRWASLGTAATATYTIDLGGYYNITGLRLNWEAAYATAYSVQLSSDGTNFSNPIYTKTNGTGGVETINATGQGRFVRLNLTAKANAAWGYSLWEVAVFGNGSSSSSSSTSSSVPSSSSVVSTSSSASNNLALGKPCSSSSTDDVTHGCEKAFDGSLSTRWSSGYADGNWISVDLGARYTLSKVVLAWEAAYGKAYRIETSDDGVNWTTVYTTTNGVGGTETLNIAGTGRYLRLYGTARATQWGFSLWEMSVYGLPAGSSSSSSSSAPSSSSIPSSRSSSSSISSSSSVRSSVSSSSVAPSQFACSVTQTGSWQGGYQVDVKVTNTGTPVNNWTVYLNYSTPAQITNSWNATLTGNNTTTVTATNVSYNGSLGTGASTTFGLSGNTPAGFSLPTCSGQPVATSSSRSSSSSSSSVFSYDDCTYGLPGNPNCSSSSRSPSSSSVSSVRSSSSLSSSVRSSSSSSSVSGEYQGVSTHFDAFGEPYGGCGIPQSKLETQNFVALNVFNSPGNYVYWTRPLTGSNLQYLGEWNNGKNCGRWVHVTIQEDCNGLNDGAQNQPFCRGGTGWFNDGKQGAELDMIVADSCGDDNAWCRDSRYHLDLATGSVQNQFAINGQPISLLPNNFNNRKISWHYIGAPNYLGDINIYFMQGAENYWPAIAINHLPNGIHGVEQLVNGVWVPAQMNSDMGQAYILQGGVSHFQIRVYDVNDQLINGGRVYNFDFPTATCGAKCTAPVTQVNYTIQ